MKHSISGHGAGGSNNTTARIKITPFFFVLLIFSHRDVDMWGMFKLAILGGRGRVLILIKNISLVLKL